MQRAGVKEEEEEKRKICFQSPTSFWSPFCPNNTMRYMIDPPSNNFKSTWNFAIKTMDWRTFYDLLSEWPFKIKLGFHSVAETFFKEKEKKNDNNNIIFRRSKAHLKIQLQRDVHNIYYFYLSHAKKVHNFCLVKFPLIYIYTTYTTILYYYWFNLMHFILLLLPIYSRFVAPWRYRQLRTYTNTDTLVIHILGF